MALFFYIYRSIDDDDHHHHHYLILRWPIWLQCFSFSLLLEQIIFHHLTIIIIIIIYRIDFIWWSYAFRLNLYLNFCNNLWLVFHRDLGFFLRSKSRSKILMWIIWSSSSLIDSLEKQVYITFLKKIINIFYDPIRQSNRFLNWKWL